MHSRRGPRGKGDAWPGAALVAIVMLVAGCSVSADASSPASLESGPTASPVATETGPALIDYARGRGDVILRFDRLPDYAMAGELNGAVFRPGPEFTLYGDGTVIFLRGGAPAPASDPPMERAAPFVTGRLTEAQAQALLHVAIDVGGLRSPQAYYPPLDTDCLSSSRFTLRTVSISADVEYACWPEAPTVEPTSATDDERQRNALAKLALYLTRFDAETGVETTLWQPDRFAAIVADLPDAPGGKVTAWPWPDLHLSDFKGPAREYPFDLSARRRVISAADAAMLGLADIQGGIQGIELGSPDGGRTTWRLALWPLFPEDDGRSSADPTPSPTASVFSTSPPTPSPEPTPSTSPSATPSPTTTPSSPPPTPWPMAVMTGNGLSKGLPFTFQVWIDHSGVAHGTFSGTVPGVTDAVVIQGAVTCAWIDGNIGVFGGLSDETGTDFTVMVSDRPDGMIIGTGRFGCDTTGFGDPAGLPITDGDILVMPEP